MIHVWTADVTALLDSETYKKYVSQLPKWRQEKAERLRFDTDKALSVGVWVLLEKMRKEYDISEDMPFNLSHSGDFAMCALSDKEDVQVGCDIEKHREWKPQLVERFFHSEEKAYIDTLQTDQEKEQMFNRYWVLKESFMKATGMGMKLELSQFAVCMDEYGEAFLGERPEMFSQDYYFKEYAMENLSYRMAVCSTEDGISSTIRNIVL